MTVIQSEIDSISVEDLETPEVQVRIEEVDTNDDSNNTEQEFRQVEDTGHRISVISDTEYNASAESNNSSRRSSVDVPHFELCAPNLNRDHHRTNNCEDGQSEVGSFERLSGVLPH